MTVLLWIEAQGREGEEIGFSVQHIESQFAGAAVATAKIIETIWRSRLQLVA